MMKRLIVLLAILLSVSFCCIAVTQPAPTRHIPIQGVVGKVHSVSVSPIAVTSSTDIAGMPFDIMGSDVQSTLRPEQGRKIATWSLLTNYYPATLTVTVNPLQGVVTGETLNYSLYVKCLYSCVGSTGSMLTVDDALVVATNSNAANTVSKRLDVPVGAITDSYISINGSPIRFQFTDSASVLDLAPDDEYVATVTFTVTSD